MMATLTQETLIESSDMEHLDSLCAKHKTEGWSCDGESDWRQDFDGTHYCFQKMTRRYAIPSGNQTQLTQSTKHE